MLRPQYVGDGMRTFADMSLEENWLPCDGCPVDEHKYPELYKHMQSVSDLSNQLIPSYIRAKAGNKDLQIGDVLLTFRMRTVYDGYLMCDGSSVNEQKYPELYKLVKVLPSIKNAYVKAL